MSTGSLLTLDLLVAVAVAGSWLAAGASAAAGRPRVAAGLVLAAATATLTQLATVLALAGAGWWFVQDRMALTAPMLVLAGSAALVVAAPALLRRGLLPVLLRPAGSPADPAGSPAHAAGPTEVPGPASAPAPAPVPGRVVVALFTAGYAALACVAVTYLVGYPVGPAEVLLAVALVTGATLVTWRVVAPARSRARTRVAAGAVLVGGIGVGLGFAPVPAVDLGGGPAAAATGGVPVTALRGPDQPAPGGTVRRHTLTAEQATVTLASGRTVAGWTYNGQIPGPPITATEGDLIEVILRNVDIRDGVTLHWHGYDLPSGEDGAPGLTQAAVSPGEEFVYRFRADQVGSYWYHTHSVSDPGVRRGLYGTLVVTPREPPEPSIVDVTDTVDIVVPVHTFDGVSVVGDQDRPAGREVPPGSPVRLRLVNTDDLPRRFALTGTGFRVVAIDGRDLHRPGELRDVAVRVPAGGRYDLAFEMPGTPVALLVDDDAAAAGLRLAPAGGDGAGPVPETAGWPALDPLRYGVPAAAPFGPESAFDRDFTLVLDRGLALVDGAPRYAHTVNGRGHPRIPPHLVAEGDLVRFTVVNRSLATHPWHLHGHSVLVLARDGEPATGAPLWLDTFDVRPGEVWEVGFTATNPGLWMNHCHNLPHAHQGMMLHLAYEGVTSPYQHH